MKRILSKTILGLSAFLLTSQIFAQITVDQVHTDSLALAFVKQQNYSKTTAPQWKFFYLTTGDEWKSYYNFSHQEEDSLQQAMHSLRWEKADINGDNKADLIVNGYIARKPGDWSTATFKILVFLSQSGKGFLQYNLLTDKAEKYPAYFDRIRLGEKDNIRLLRWQLAEQTGENAYLMDTLSYSSYWGNFLNEHSDPPIQNPIQSIDYKYQEDPQGSFHQLHIDDVSDKKTNMVISTFQSGDKDTATYKARLTKALNQQIDTLCWRIQIQATQNNKATVLNHQFNSQDLPVTLTLKFKDGTQKTIIDYGAEGSFTLMTVYSCFENIIQNVFDQMQQKQELIQSMSDNLFDY